MTPRHPCPTARRTAAFLLLWTLVGVSCSPQDHGTRGEQVILIMLDAARADRFSAYGYERQTTPVMGRLAEEGALFLNHCAHASNTRLSLPTLLLSRYFAPSLFHSSAQVPLELPEDLFYGIDEACLSVPELFAMNGYTSASISAHTWTCEGTRYAQLFQEVHDLPSMLEYDADLGFPTADQVVDYTMDWLDEQEEGQQTFLYLHFMDTHFPHPFGPEAQEWFGADEFESDQFVFGGGLVDESKPLEADERRYLDALYDGSLTFVDRQIGRLLEHLERRGWREQTTVLITADHGENLLEVPGRFRHTGDLIEPLLKVPMILHRPGVVPPQREESFSGAVDVLPTLARVQGLELPSAVHSDGIDLLEVLQGRVPGKDHELARHGIFGPRYKAVFTDPEPLLRKEGPALDELACRVYDLQEDPLEQRNLRRQLPEVTQDLLDAYREQMLPRWERFQGSRTGRVPTHPFAVAAKHFSFTPGIPQVRTVEDLDAVAAAQMPDGWLRAYHVTNFGLFGRSHATPLTVEVPIPSGTYQVSVALRGALEFRTDDQEEFVLLRASPMDPILPHDGEEVSLGEIQVQDDRFRLHLRPAASAKAQDWSLVKYLAFRSSQVDPDAPEQDQAYLDRLRALGYLGGDEGGD